MSRFLCTRTIHVASTVASLIVVINACKTETSSTLSKPPAQTEANRVGAAASLSFRVDGMRRVHGAL